MSKRDRISDSSGISVESIESESGCEVDLDWLNEASSRVQTRRPLTDEEISFINSARSPTSLEERAANIDATLLRSSNGLLGVWTVRGVSEEARRRAKIAALMTKQSIGAFVDEALLDAMQKNVETLRRIALATPKCSEGKIWTIRGIRPETRRLSRIAALQLGWTVGEFVDRALLDATKQLQIENFASEKPIDF